ncbi:MAG: RNA methyltransferase [Acidobacteriota bacterium]|nr:RNA methyltransferase [Acidobacteriota bacterium]
MREITSASNPMIKAFRRALKEGVTREGWLAIEGPLLIQEALSAAGDGREKRGAACRCVIRSVLAARTAARKFADLLARMPSGAEIAETPDIIFSRIAATASPQGIAALIEVETPDLERIFRLPNAMIAVVDGLQDPGNLGTILRSAEAFSADALVTLKSTVSPYNPKILRASGGAVFRMPVFPAFEREAFYSRLRPAGLRLVAADPHSRRSIGEADLSGPVAILIGSEAAGLPAGIPSADRVAIPLRPEIDSLNAAVAAGIFLYECARQRGFRY